MHVLPWIRWADFAFSLRWCSFWRCVASGAFIRCHHDMLRVQAEQMWCFIFLHTFTWQNVWTRIRSRLQILFCCLHVSLYQLGGASLEILYKSHWCEWKLVNRQNTSKQLSIKENMSEHVALAGTGACLGPAISAFEGPRLLIKASGCRMLQVGYLVAGTCSSTMTHDLIFITPRRLQEWLFLSMSSLRWTYKIPNPSGWLLGWKPHLLLWGNIKARKEWNAVARCC